MKEVELEVEGSHRPIRRGRGHPKKVMRERRNKEFEDLIAKDKELPNVL